MPAYVSGLGLNGLYGFSFAYISAAVTQIISRAERLIPAGNGGPGLVGSERDVAFLTLPRPLGDATGWFALDHPTFKQGRANLTGYPDAYGFRLTSGVAYTFEQPFASFINLHWFKPHPGISGGPVRHFDSEGRPSVVAFLSSGIGGRGGAAFEIATSHESILGWIASNDHLLA